MWLNLDLLNQMRTESGIWTSYTKYNISQQDMILYIEVSIWVDFHDSMLD